MLSPSSQTSIINRNNCCAICDGKESSYHYGAFSCKACAAFFRRTVTKKKSFVCAHENNGVTGDARVKTCPACRYEKCISAGMIESKVISHGMTPRKRKDQKNEALQRLQLSLVLSKPQKFDYSSYFSSHQNNVLLQKMLIANYGIEHQRMSVLPQVLDPFYKNCFIPNLAKHILHESRLCHVYLKATGIIVLAKDAVNEKTADIVCFWSYLTMVLNTLQNDSIPFRKVAMIDHSMLEMSESSIKECYATEPYYLKHLDMIVSTALPIWYRTEALINQVHAMDMTNEEKAYFKILCLIEVIIRLSSKPKSTRFQFKPLLDTIFRSINYYYSANFSKDCTAVRLGNLIMALPLMNEISTLFNEHRTLIILCNSCSENFTPLSLLRAFRSKYPVKSEQVAGKVQPART